jgi:hypothetical protein
MLTEYEQERARNVARNEAKLQELGLLEPPRQAPPPKKRQRSPEPQTVECRSSARLRDVPRPTYVDEPASPPRVQPRPQRKQSAAPPTRPLQPPPTVEHDEDGDHVSAPGLRSGVSSARQRCRAHRPRSPSALTVRAHRLAGARAPRPELCRRRRDLGGFAGRVAQRGGADDRGGGRRRRERHGLHHARGRGLHRFRRELLGRRRELLRFGPLI